MQSVPRVSILMAVYNAGHYLKESIDSILGQTFTDFELIIVDDASTDNSREIILSYSDPRIVFIQNAKNLRLVKSLHVALKHARGEYIARQDADDISESARLAQQVKFLNQNPDVALVGANAVYIDKNSAPYKLWEVPETHEELIEKLKEGSCFCHGSVMFRKSCIETVGFYREKMLSAEDYDYWLRISEKFRVANISEILYRYRRIISGISSHNLSLLLDYHLLALMMSKERKEKGKDSLAELDTSSVPTILVRKYRLTLREINAFKSEIYLHYSREYLQLKSYGDGIRFWWSSFRLAPAKWKIRSLLNAFVSDGAGTEIARRNNDRLPV